MGKNILIVDDDPDIIDLVTVLIEELGHTPVIARNGEEGMNLVRRNNPSLVIMDLLMPKKSGIKMFRELKTDKALKMIPVIVMSAIAKNTYLRSQDALSEFGGGTVPEPDAYMEKPVEPDDLLKKIRELAG
jgi:CheY-like chemotaxis protein